MASGGFEMTCPGRALAQVLAGCWRSSPPPLEMSAARLEALSPLLVGSGAGALAWRRLRDSASSEHPSAALLHQAHIEQLLRARLHESRIEKSVRTLREHGIEPLLLKGWSCARLYPEPGLRPMGDIDLVVRPEQGALAGCALSVPVDSDEGLEDLVELRTSLRPIHGLGLDEALDEAQRFPVGRESIQVLGHEHHLRLLCLHFLRHGAWRPLWLCDIAAALEVRPQSFDWGRCLGPDRLRAGYVACTLGLAHQLLGARVEGTPIEARARHLPSWLVPAVLDAWAAPMPSQHQGRPLLSSVPRRLGPLLRALLLRWPNPVEAAVATRMPLGVHPLPAQTLYYGGIWLRFARSSACWVRDHARGTAS